MFDHSYAWVALVSEAFSDGPLSMCGRCAQAIIHHTTESRREVRDAARERARALRAKLRARRAKLRARRSKARARRAEAREHDECKDCCHSDGQRVPMATCLMCVSPNCPADLRDDLVRAYGEPHIPDDKIHHAPSDCMCGISRTLLAAEAKHMSLEQLDALFAQGASASGRRRALLKTWINRVTRAMAASANEEGEVKMDTAARKYTVTGITRDDDGTFYVRPSCYFNDDGIESFSMFCRPSSSTS